MLSYQDKTQRRLRVAALFSLALHILLLVAVGVAPPSLPGHSDTPGALNITLEKNPNEPPRPAANAETGQQGAEAARPETAPPSPPAPRTPPPAPAAETAEASAPKDILTIAKPEAEKPAEQTFKLPEPPAPSPEKSESPALLESLRKTEEPPLPAPDAGAAAAKIAPPMETPAVPAVPVVAPQPAPQPQPEKIAALPPPVQEEKTPVRIEPPVNRETPAPPQPETPRPEAPRPAPSEQTQPAKPTPADTGRPVTVREKPAGYDVSGLAGLDISSLKKPAEDSGPKIRFGERRKVIGLREQDLTYQLYAESVRLKLERVGRFNYPIEAARRNISGTMVVLISIREDGSLENFSVVRPSYDVLNAAADRIVHMSAPFSPFPEKIRQDLDVLTIQIVWTFSSSNQSFE